MLKDRPIMIHCGDADRAVAKVRERKLDVLKVGRPTDPRGRILACEQPDAALAFCSFRDAGSSSGR